MGSITHGKNSLDDITHVQHLVIGSGPGGAVTAALLAEAGKEVLILEQGPCVSLEDTIPFSPSEMVDKYRNGGLTAAFGDPKVSYVEARCVGGGSEVNSGLYYAPPIDLLKNWERRCGLADSYEIAIAAKQVERDLQVQYMPAGIPGASQKLADGAAALSWNVQEVPRWYSYNEEGKGVKQSMTRTYLPRARRASAQLISGQRVVAINRRGELWSVDVVSSAGCPRTVLANYVFLCAGAIHSAALLRKSGLSRRAGRTLYMHPSIKVTALFGETVNSMEPIVPVHQVKQFSPKISLGCSISQPHHLRLALMSYLDGDDLVRSNWQKMSTYYAMIQDGVGSVRNVPFFRDPFVQFNVGREGVVNLKNGLKLLCECLFAAGAKTLFPSAAGGQPLHKLADAVAFVDKLSKEDMQLMTIHLMGTCPIGRDSSSAVVNSYGEVFGHDGLFVNDASILPSAMGVNPQGTIMAFAMRNTRRFLRLDGVKSA